MDIYTHKKLYIPLTIDEYKVLSHVWRLIKMLSNRIDNTSHENKTRESLIKKVRKSFKLDEFYILENIVNKLFWNLRIILYYYYFDDKDIKLSRFSCELVESDDISKLKLSSNEDHINKKIIYDKKDKIFLKFYKADNQFNKLCSHILGNRNLYESVMEKPIISKKIKLREDENLLYYLPNINYCRYYFGNLEQRLNRIKKMYFYNGRDIDYYWYNFINRELIRENDENNDYLHYTEYATYLTDSEESEEVNKLSSDSQNGGVRKWKTFCHNGVLFPPEYTPHRVPLIYDGKKITLDERSEEAATLYAKYLESDYIKNPTFRKNFWNEWKKMLNKSYGIDTLEKCDFSLIHQFIIKEKDKIKNLTKEEKEKIKNEKEEKEKKYKTALVDGLEQPVGNFRIEPPGIFIGRGCHPKMGKIKKRLYPTDITINIGKDCTIPIPMENPEYSWRRVIHDKSVEWLASWKDSISGKNKYVWLGSHSNFKAMSDKSKFDFAKKLKRKIKGIRRQYYEDMQSDNLSKRQLAIALYLIDTLALRIGNEKGEGEADTVGVTSLRKEHIKLGDGNKITLDFLGKDSVRYVKTIITDDIVYKNLVEFERDKKPSQDLFDKINPATLNRYIQSYMKDLTAKVFRTYNASLLMQKDLNKSSSRLKNNDTLTDIEVLLESLNKANIRVAVLCNHRKKVSNTFDQQIDRMNQKIKDLQKKKRKIKKIVKNKERIDKINRQINKVKSQKSLKIELKDLSLETSKANYIDPRIIVAYTKRNNIPINKVYSKQLQNKFSWAMDADENYKF